MQREIIRSSDISRGLYRFDAEYHVGIKNIGLFNRNYYTLGDLSDKIVQGPNPVFSESGIQCLNGKNINFGTASANVPNYMSQEEFKKFKNYQLCQGDILITLKHATHVGRAWIFDNSKLSIFSRNLGLIRVKQNSEINVFTLLFYLWGDKAQALLNLIATGGTNGQITLSMAELRNFPVPSFSKEFQDQIRSVYLAFENSIHKSKEKYQEAENLLLSELGLLNWNPKRQLSFVKNYSDIHEFGRFDAEYFQPRYDEIVGAIRNCPAKWDLLGNLVSIKKGIEVGSQEYIESGIQYLRVSNISPYGLTEEKYISNELYLKLTPLEEPNTLLAVSKNYQPKKGEILLSKDATPGVAYYLIDKPQTMIPSGGILRLKTKTDEIKPECLYLILNSLVVQEQINRDVGGSVILHWRPDQVKKTLIPIFKCGIQEKIRENIIESYVQKITSKQLLECAKKSVEMAIERNELAALEWLKDQIRIIGVEA